MLSPEISGHRARESVVERDAKVRLKREHNKLVGKLAFGGGCLTLVVFLVLLVVADAMSRAAGHSFVLSVALVAATAFAILLVPQYADGFLRRMPAPNDPLTGRPLRMLWWWRWMAGALTLFMFVALPDYRDVGNTRSPSNPSALASPETTPTVPASPASPPEVELDEARKTFCAYSPTFGDGIQSFLSAHMKIVFHITDEEANAFAEQVEREKAQGELDCVNILKTLEVVNGPERLADSLAIPAATIFCDEWYPTAKPETTVEKAELGISSRPCAGSDLKTVYCANGQAMGPSNDIAEHFKITWQQANADIVAGLARFDPHGPFYGACAQLDKDDPGDAVIGPDDYVSDAELITHFCSDYSDPSINVSEFQSEIFALASGFAPHQPPSEEPARSLTNGTMANFCQGPFRDAYKNFCSGLQNDPSGRLFTVAGYAKYLRRLWIVMRYSGPDSTLADFCDKTGPSVPTR